jgi:inner membrane protein
MLIVQLSHEPNQMVTASVVGSSLKLNYCELSRAIVFLKDHYAVGTVESKVVQSRSPL